jgi:hypothetical protein
MPEIVWFRRIGVAQLVTRVVIEDPDAKIVLVDVLALWPGAFSAFSL